MLVAARTMFEPTPDDIARIQMNGPNTGAEMDWFLMKRAEDRRYDQQYSDYLAAQQEAQYDDYCKAQARDHYVGVLRRGLVEGLI